MTVADQTDQTAVFERCRPRLFGIAYRMLGAVEDAEDLVQETYLRWQQADAQAVRTPERWLVAVVTRLSIDRLRRAVTERRAYAGHWLPEPVVTADWAAPDRTAELASDLSMAFLVLLERLAPEERAAFLLREVFDCDYGEIARILARTEAACRQIVHRARVRVRGGPLAVRRPRTREGTTARPFSRHSRPVTGMRCWPYSTRTRRGPRTGAGRWLRRATCCRAPRGSLASSSESSGSGRSSRTAESSSTANPPS